jgi:hypothetical protein
VSAIVGPALCIYGGCPSTSPMGLVALDPSLGLARKGMNDSNKLPPWKGLVFSKRG